MDKTAQKRSFLNKLKEMSDISGISMEKLFDTEFKKVMDNIREKDAKIRSIAVGKSIDGADPGSDAISLKDLLKSARSNFNKREYMIVIDELGRFHNKLMSIANVVKSLSPIDQDEQDKKTHREFLMKDLDEERRSRLSNLGERFASVEDQLIAEAGLEDFFAKFKRGRALKAFEERYPEQIKQFRTDIQGLLSSSERTFSRLVGALKEMDAARSSRNPTAYRRAATKISADWQPYHDVFDSFYKTHVRELKELLAKKPEAGQKVPAAPIQHSTQFGNQEVAPGFTPAVVGKPLSDAPSGLELQSAPPGATTEPPSDTADTEPSPPPENMYKQIQRGTLPGLAPQPTGFAPPSGGGISGGPPAGGPLVPPTIHAEPAMTQPGNTLPYGVKAHRKFYEELQSLSNEHPLVMASHIKKYAVSIQESDPETSIQLFKVVRSIKRQ